MNRSHILLFIISCCLLYFSDVFAGALIALALIFQMNLLYYQIPLTKKSQVAALKLFIYSAPLFFFLGGIHSLILLYFGEGQWLFLGTAMVISYFLFFLVNFFCFFVYQFFVANDFNVSATYQNAFMQIKNEKKDLFVQTFFLLIISLVPMLAAEWKIIFSVTVVQMYLHRQWLKPVFGF